VVSYHELSSSLLLGRFAPGWQPCLFAGGVTLEGLLAEAMDD